MQQEREGVIVSAQVTPAQRAELERRAVDAVFRALPVVALPGYSRPLIRVSDYLALLDDCTFDGSRVR
jgi:hypothetical protein